MKAMNDKRNRELFDEYNDYEDYEATEERLDKYGISTRTVQQSEGADTTKS